MSSNYALHHAGHPCSAEHHLEYHTPGYLHDGIDDANLDGESKHPVEQANPSSYRSSGVESDPESHSQSNGVAPKNTLCQLKPPGQKNIVSERSQSQQSSGSPQSEGVYVPAHITNANGHRPHNKSGEPGPMDRVAGLAEEVLFLQILHWRKRKNYASTKDRSRTDAIEVDQLIPPMRSNEFPMELWP
ncbi:hypothetical protein BJ165DRAFT_1399515 [Panaeolus papilionaceus]|nr:hypothetical protein BJ165DRAFT_1399515 [Panaeolus papilionaceus]